MKTIVIAALAAAALVPACAPAPEFRYGEPITDIDFFPISPTTGIFPDISVLDDPKNPFADSAPSETMKWTLQSKAGPVAAYYGWATLNARTPGGESQYYVGVNLQAIYAKGDAAKSDVALAREMGIKAYQTVLDAFPGSVTYDPSGTIAYDLSLPAYKGIQALGGKVQGGFILIKGEDGTEKVVGP